MNERLYRLCAAVLLLSPVVAAAQAAAPAPRAPVSPAPAVAPAAPGPEDDMGMVLADLFGFDGPGDAPLVLGEAPEAPEGPGEGPMAFDDEGSDSGPGGAEHMHRHVPGGPRGRAMMMRRGLGMRLAALDLTDAQRDKLRDIHEAAARKSVQRRADMELARMDLRKLMRADSPTTSSVNAQIDKITRLQADGMKARFDTFMQARAVLTPEQLKKLRSGPAEMREHTGHGEHGGHGED